MNFHVTVTADLASRGTDGYITFIGRTDGVFKPSDYKVSPFELESVLIEHPSAAEAAAVPTPDPVRLTVPKASHASTRGCRPYSGVSMIICLDMARQMVRGFP